MNAMLRRGSPVERRRARTNPNAVIPMKVPPSSAAETTISKAFVARTDIATPAASARHAIAKLRSLPQRRPIHVHSATEGTAARPTTSHITGSMDRISGEVLTIVEMNVAVIT